MTLTWSEAVAFGAGALTCFVVERIAKTIRERSSARQAICALLTVEAWGLLPFITVTVDGVQLFSGGTSALVNEVQGSDPATAFIHLGEMTRSQGLEVTVAEATIQVSVPRGPGHSLIVEVAADHTVRGYFLEDLMRKVAQ